MAKIPSPKIMRGLHHPTNSILHGKNSLRPSDLQRPTSRHLITIWGQIQKNQKIDKITRSGCKWKSLGSWDHFTTVTDSSVKITWAPRFLRHLTILQRISARTSIFLSRKKRGKFATDKSWRSIFVIQPQQEKMLHLEHSDESRWMWPR